MTLHIEHSDILAFTSYRVLYGKTRFVNRVELRTTKHEWKILAKMSRLRTSSLMKCKAVLTTQAWWCSAIQVRCCHPPTATSWQLLKAFQMCRQKSKQNLAFSPAAHSLAIIVWHLESCEVARFEWFLGSWVLRATAVPFSFFWWWEQLHLQESVDLNCGSSLLHWEKLRGEKVAMWQVFGFWLQEEKIN